MNRHRSAGRERPIRPRRKGTRGLAIGLIALISVVGGAATATAAVQVVGGDWVLPIDSDAANQSISASDDSRWVLGSLQSLITTYPGAQSVSTIDLPGSNQPVMGLNGDIIVARETDNQTKTEIRAIAPDGSTRYATSLDGTYVTMAIGGDGATYVYLVSRPSDINAEGQVVRMDAQGQVLWRRGGLPAAGQIERQTALNTTGDGVSVLYAAAYDGGADAAIVIHADSSVFPPSPLGGPPNCMMVTHDVTSNQLGDSYVARTPYRCADSSDVSVSRIAADGTVAWTVARPVVQSGGLSQLSALPDGDVLLVNDRYNHGEVLGRASGEVIAANQWPGDPTFDSADNTGTLSVTTVGTDVNGSTFFLVVELYRLCPGAQHGGSCQVIELRRRSSSGAIETIGKRIPEEGTFRLTLRPSPQLMRGWVVYHEIEEQNFPERTDRLVGFSVPSSSGPYRPYTMCPQRVDCSTESPGSCEQRGDCVFAPPPPEGPPTRPKRVPVVLVTGLNANSDQVLPELASPLNPAREASSCGKAGDFAAICQRLRGAGHPVYVIPSGSGNDNGAVALDNKGDIDENAQRLRDFVRNRVVQEQGVRPLLVGHSMGGLISRIAISRHGALAAGLFTIGTPHSGSFGADLIKGATILPCPPRAILGRPIPAGIACHEMKARAVAFLNETGAKAVSGLTAVARAADNLTLAPVGWPTWVYAGTMIDPPGSFDPTGYVYPNDGIVGRSSAWGFLANLGTKTTYERDLWHLTQFPVLNKPSRPNEFEDPDVAEKVAEAAGSIPMTMLSARSGRFALPRATAERGIVVSSSAEGPTTTAQGPKALRVRTTLTTATSARTKADRAMPLRNAEQVYAAAPFTLVCRGHEVQASQLARKLFGVLPGSLACPRVSVRSRKSLRLVVASRTSAVRATATRRGARTTIVIRSSAPMTNVRAHVGNRVRRAVSGRRQVTIAIPKARARTSVVVRVTVARRPYAGTLRLP